MPEYYVWIMIGLGILGFLLTWTGIVVSVTKAVSAIKADTSEQISIETAKITDRLTEIHNQFEHDQRAQDNSFGEVGLSLRQYIANVEKEMHQIEIWGRDNFVLKTDFVKATDRIEAAIAAMTVVFREEMQGIRKDLRDIGKE